MIKYISIVVVFLGLQACSSNSKKLDSGSKPTSLSNSSDSFGNQLPAESSIDDREAETPTPIRTRVIADSKALKEAISRQDDDKIYSEATHSLENNPQDTVALNALAIFYYKKGQFDVSLSLLSEALKINPKSANFYSNRGVIYLAKNEDRLAIESFRKALELNSEHVEASVNLGSLYLKGNDFDRAFVAYENAFDHGYRDFKFLLNYGILAKEKGKFSLSEDIYKGLLKQQSNSREVLYNYAILLIEDLKSNDKGLDVIQKLKFIGEPQGTHRKIKELEEIAKGDKK